MFTKNRIFISFAILLLALMLMAANSMAIPPSISIVQQTNLLLAGQTGSFSALCPVGSVVTGGGAEFMGDLYWYGSYKSGNGWQVRASNPTAVNGQITVYATCLHDTRGSTSQEKDGAIVAPDSLETVSVECPVGSVLVSGGFYLSSNDNSVKIIASRKQANGWMLAVQNLTNQKQSLRVFATCLSGVDAKSYEAVDSDNSVPVVPVSTAPSCAAGGLLTGGGYKIPLALDVFMHFPFDGGGFNFWQTTVWEEPGPSLYFEGYAVCLTL
ncbi:MAG: hypothetical protein DWQ07_06935 [Chloroflexi bacterium]|nr:MAG: hypothetical protein DWQ07_06935 [Chloroflexota bacterium]MBL1195564.1 hypothetical protein [Chloroflexota bacterium]NOH12847.1 hypothetical protein [Chloroflexota bacterium]